MAEWIARPGSRPSLAPSPEGEITPGGAFARAAAGARARELGLMLLGLLALLAVEVAVVRPAGEFPVNDDWAFYRIAKHWAETGRFEYVGWNQMMLVTQAALGALVIKLFGFSFEGPRWLVLGLGVVSLLALYGCGRELGVRPRVAALVTLAVAICPLHLYSAYTFMSEIPFQALFMLTLWAYLRLFQTGSRRTLFLATLLAFVAFMERQTALFFPVGALLYTAWLRPPALADPVTRRALWGASLACVGAMGLALVWRVLMPDHDDKPTFISECLALGTWGLIKFAVAVPFRVFCAFQYLGLYSLPVVVAFAGPALEAARRRPRLALGCLVTVVALTAVAYGLPRSLTDAGRSMPYLDHFLNDRVHGFDGVLLRGTGPQLLDRTTRALLTVAAIPGAALLLFMALSLGASLTRRRGDGETGRQGDAEMGGREDAETRGHGDAETRGWGEAAGFVSLQWLLQFAFVVTLSGRIFERYYLLLLAPALLLLAYALNVAPPPLPLPASLRPRVPASPPHLLTRPASALLAAASLAFSLANLHDYFAVYREVAVAVQELRAEGIPTGRIDAGFAWAGWHHPGPLRRTELQPRSSRDIWYLARLYPRLQDDYAISLTRDPRRPVLRTRRYHAWLPWPGAPRTLWILGPRQGHG